MLVPWVGACAKSMPGLTVTEHCIEKLLQHAPAQTTASEIFGVCDADDVVVVFAAFKQGSALDLADSTVGIALARRVSATTDGARDVWQSYFNRVEMPDEGEWPLTTPAIQATRDSGGVLVAHGNGLYHYVLDADVRAITSPVAVPWMPDAVHRISMEFRGAVQGPDLGSPVYDWIPATGVPVAPQQHAVVRDAKCLECHDVLAFHGGARIGVDNCVTCHNPGSVDANSGHSLDFAEMTHKIHMGRNLPSVQGGEEYTLWGFQDGRHDYSTVRYSQDMRNCRKCHDPEDPRTPLAGNMHTVQSQALCVSCHDNVRFDVDADTFLSGDYPDWQTYHTGGPQDGDAGCAACHGPGRQYDVEQSHLTLFATPHNPHVPEGVPVFKYEMLTVKNTGAGEQPVVRFRIRRDGQPLDLKNLPDNYTSVPRFLLAWASPEGVVQQPSDWNNRDQIAGQPIRRNMNIDNLVDEGDGIFSTTPGDLGTVPATAVMAAVSLESFFTVDGLRLGAESLLAGSEEELPRRRIVDMQKCNLCHERMSFHGGNRIDNVDQCAICHNPNSTDIAVRPATITDGVTGAFSDFAAVGVDGLHERSIDFKYMIHAIHMGENLTEEQLVFYGFMRSIHEYADVRMPRRVSNCLICHDEGSYELPLDLDALAVSMQVAEAATMPADLTDATGHLNISPAAAACMGCHDSRDALAHMQAARIHWRSDLSGTEIDGCAVCHGSGTAFDVNSVHKVPFQGQ